MRLEQLFLQLDHFLAGHSIVDMRAAISVLLDILTIFSRSDLKSEIIKELERHTKMLKLLGNNLEVDSEKLAPILNDFNQASKSLYETNGKIGIKLMESDLFQSISQRSSIPGGSCSFDLPAYHYWLEQDPDLQKVDLERWTQPFTEVRNAIGLILGLLRQSGHNSQQIAENGFFQLGLDKDHPAQLLRVSVAKSLQCFAEISGGKHRFSIRFMQPSSDENRPSQVSIDIPFKLTRCMF
jgi:cell division protein ZapD